MEVYQCKICFEEFNLTDKAPHSLALCGHAFCQTCLKRMIQDGNRGAEPHIKCPICKIVIKNPIISDGKAALTVANENKAESCELPKAFFIIDLLLMNQNKLKCDHPLRKFFCLDKNCKNNGMQCLSCLRKFHFNCNEEFIGEKNKLKFIRNKKAEKLTRYFDKKVFHIKISEKMKELEKIVHSIETHFEKTSVNLINLYNHLESNPELIFTDDNWKTTVTKSPNQQQFKLSTPKIDQLEKFTEFMESFPEKLMSGFLGVIEQIFLDSLPIHSVIFKELFHVDPQTLEFFSDRNRSLMSRVYLKDFKSFDKFSFSSFFDNMKKHAEGIKLNTLNESSSKFTVKELKTVREIVGEEIERLPKNIHLMQRGVENALEAKLNRKFKVRVCFGEYMSCQDSLKYFLKKYLFGSDLSISIQENE